MSKQLPTSIATFRNIIRDNYLYIDKTQYIYRLAQYGRGAYFFSRPRRFGKSLLVSTLKEFFLGNRELFSGLWVDSSDYHWESYPVMQFNFSLEPVKTPSGLEDTISTYLGYVAEEYGIELADGPYYRQFRSLIQKMAKEKPVVILIDEYDKPMIDNIEDPEQAVKIRDVLKGFYGVIKAMDEHIRMVFITGISKFSKVGVFSDMNNLMDLTLNHEFGTALGLTEAEIRDNLAGHITTFAQEQGVSDEALLEEIRYWYNGFCFAAQAENVYNPFSTLLLFYHRRFASYWFESGTPTFLIKLIHDRNEDVEELDKLELDEIAFSTYEVDRLAIVPLLFQTGYLTIKSYDPDTRYYRLGYPNYEVEHAFRVYILEAFSNVQQGLSITHIGRLITALQNHELDQFFKVLQVLFANIDYDLHLKYEKYYQTIFYLTFKLMGLRIDAEVKTSVGRIDAVVELVDRLYLFEFKLNKDATVALDQIDAKKYHEKYAAHGKIITQVGANFDSDKRTITDWKFEEICL